MNLIGILNPNSKFSLSVWSWRPIHSIIEFVNEKYDLEIDTENFGFDIGAGIEDPEVCGTLREFILEELEGIGLKDKSDTVYFPLGSWKNFLGGEFIPMEESKKMGLKKYNGKILNTPIYSDKVGGLIVPTHFVDGDTVERFCDFLQECGGFEIW